MYSLLLWPPPLSSLLLLKVRIGIKDLLHDFWSHLHTSYQKIPSKNEHVSSICSPHQLLKHAVTITNIMHFKKLRACICVYCVSLWVYTNTFYSDMLLYLIFMFCFIFFAGNHLLMWVHRRHTIKKLPYKLSLKYFSSSTLTATTYSFAFYLQKIPVRLPYSIIAATIALSQKWSVYITNDKICYIDFFCTFSIVLASEHY